VLVPVAAGVGSGEVTLEVSLTASDGTPVGDTVRIPANVRADWEGLGASVLAAIAVIVFGVGIWRNISRRRRQRAEAAAQGEADAAGRTDAAGEPAAAPSPQPGPSAATPRAEADAAPVAASDRPQEDPRDG
jgi:flagellar biosynthesis/type III secretory pathway M-ring protein FliF/YscJ